MWITPTSPWTNRTTSGLSRSESWERLAWNRGHESQNVSGSRGEGKTDNKTIRDSCEIVSKIDPDIPSQQRAVKGALTSSRFRNEINSRGSVLMRFRCSDNDFKLCRRPILVGIRSMLFSHKFNACSDERRPIDVGISWIRLPPSESKWRLSRVGEIMLKSQTFIFRKKKRI